MRSARRCSDIETLIGALNADEDDPLARLCGGMIGAAAFALSERKRAAVLIRSARGMTLEQHVLNRGVIADLGAVGAAHRLVPAAGRNLGSRDTFGEIGLAVSSSF